MKGFPKDSIFGEHSGYVPKLICRLIKFLNFLSEDVHVDSIYYVCYSYPLHDYVGFPCYSVS